jgi:hypothetical protein
MAANNKDALTPEQSKAAQAIAAVMAKLAVDSEKALENLRGQAKAMQEICEAMKCFESSQAIQNVNQLAAAIGGVGDISKTASASIIELGRNTQNLAGNVGALGGQIGSTGRQTKEFNKEGKSSARVQKDLAAALDKTKKTSLAVSVALGALIGAYDGLKVSMSATLAVSKGILGFFGSMVSAAYSVAKSIVAIPFKMLGSLVEMADQGGNSISEFAEAINGMRKEFGALSGPTNKAIMGTATAMNNLTIAGTSTFQVFGNVAERMKMLTELYATAGPNLRSFAQEIEKGNGAALAMQKGLGLTAEGMETLASISKSSGKPLSETLVNVTKHADHMAKRFGLDAKLISKDLVKAAGDFRNFGNVSIKEMGVAVTYAQKLGLSLDKITGTMDAFGTFDDAADNVSKLNEAFGTNIDAMEIMQAETPQEKLELLRKEMRKAGIDGEKLNNVQRKLISSATGLDDQAIISAMSTKNYGVSLKEIQKEGGKAEKKTLTQAEAMEKLADAMERMLKPGQSLTGGKGLFGSFMAGVMKGIETSPEFIQMLGAVKRAIGAFFTAGIEVGRKFVALFPGIKDLFSAITKIFNPAKVTQMTKGITAAFTQFFKDIGDPNSKNSFGKLMENLQKSFFNFFNSNTQEGKELINAFKKIFLTIVRIIGEAIPYVMQQITKIALAITEFIKNPKAYLEKLGGGGGDSGFGKVFSEAFENIRAAWPALRDALKGLFKVAFERLKNDVWPLIKPTVEKIGEFLLKGFLLRTVVSMVLGAMLGLLKNALLGAIEALFTGGGEGLTARFAGGMRKLLGPTLAKVLGKAFVVTAIADAAINISKSMEEFTDVLQKKGFDPATSKIAAGTTGLINTITFGLLPKDLQSKIAESVARISETIFKALDKWFGPGFSDSVKKVFASFFDFFAGIGDLLLGLWNGDQSKVEAAFKKIGESLWGFLMGAIEFVGNLAIKIGPLLLSYLTSAIGWLLEKISSVLEGLKSSPVLRIIVGIFTFGLSEVLIFLAPAIKKLGELFTGIGDFFKEVYETVKQVNITQMFRDIGDAIVEFATNVWNKITWLADVITLPFRLFYYGVKTIIQAVWEEVISPVIGFIAEWGGKLLDLLTWPFKKMYEFVSGVAKWISDNVFAPVSNTASSFGTKLLDLLSMPFKKMYEVWIGVQTYLLETFANLLESFRVWGNKVLAILTDPHTKAWDKIKKVLSYIWDGFKELPGKLVEWGKGLLEKITSPFKDAWSWVKENFSIEKFKEIGGNIIDGIKQKLSELKDTVTKPFKDSWEGVKSLLGINSPSKKFAELGQNVVDGFSQNLGDIFDTVTAPFDSAYEVVIKLVQSFKDMANKIFLILTDPFSNSSQKIDKIFGAVKSFFEKMVAAISTLAKDIFKIISKPFEDAWESIGKIWSLDAVGKLFSKIVEGIKGALGKLAEIPAFQALIDLAKKVFDIKSPSRVFQKIGDQIAGGLQMGVENIPKNAEKTFGKVTDQATKMVDKIETSIPMDGINKKLGALVDKPGNITAGADAMNSVVAKQVIPAVVAVEQMIAAAQRIESALSAGAKLDIDTKLKVFASKFGKSIGTMGKYVVQAKDVNIHVNFRIALDATELERVMVTNGKSVIKQRINLLLDAVKDDGKSTVIKTDAERAKMRTGATPSDMNGYDY